MYKIYIGDNYPLKFETDEIITALKLNSILENDPKNADIFIFLINYEKLYGYTKHEYDHYNYTELEIEQLKKKLFDMVELSKMFNKKTILFYYYDPVKKIDIPNTIIFRTSLLKSAKSKNEFALPAYMKDLRKRKSITEDKYWLNKTNKPSVGFRGQSAPVKLPVKLMIKRQINEVLKYTGISKQLNLHYNFGYLARRDAIVACSKNKTIDTSFTLTTMEQSWDPINSKIHFVNNVFDNQYNLCVSGHGNYSFRLYEIMSAGRIPVFINTDCVLPFEEFIDWRKHVVWIEEKDAIKADKYILEFHNSIHPDDFLQLQKSNRQLWEKYLSKNGFFQSLHLYFPLIKEEFI